MRIIVISGLIPRDSGKTTFMIALANALKSVGYSVRVFKPVAGHSAWFQHESFMESIALGVLVGEDVLTYMKEGLIEDVDLQNPIDILTAPHDVANYGSVPMYLESLESGIRQAVLARISIHGRRYFLIEDNLGKIQPSLRKEIISALKEFGPYEEVNSEWLMNKLTSEEIGAYIAALTQKLASRKDFLLIESFNDAILPVGSLAPLIDAAVVVTPGRALIYGSTKTKSYLRITFPNRVISRYMVELMRPDAEIEIKPFGPARPYMSRKDVEAFIEAIA